MKRTCIITSPVATQSGYGHHAREIIDNFIDQKNDEWDIKLISMPWGHTPFTFPISIDWQKRVIPLPITSQPDIWVQITIPNEFQAVGKYNIGVTAVTEGDICSKEWIESINKMNLIIVPSEFAKKVLTDSSIKYNIPITTNIQVVSEYFNESVYNKKNNNININELDEIHESFCYLFVGHWLQGTLGEDRKNISGLIKTFFDTFKNSQKMPALILKTSGATYSVNDQWELEGKINELQELYGDSVKLPNIYLLHGDLFDHEMNALYNHKKVKAMVSFTKGEGFGRPLLEFGTTGKPIIAPVYSGQADFLKSVIALSGGLTQVHPSAANKWILKESKWFTPDYNAAKKEMKQLYKHYNKYLPMAREQKKFIESNFTKTAVSKQYEHVLKIVQDSLEDIPQPQQLQLPKLNLPNVQKSDSNTKLQLPKLNKV